MSGKKRAGRRRKVEESGENKESRRQTGWRRVREGERGTKR